MADTRTIVLPREEPGLSDVIRPDDPRIRPNPGALLAALSRGLERIAPNAMAAESRIEGIPADMTREELAALLSSGGQSVLPSDGAPTIEVGPVTTTPTGNGDPLSALNDAQLQTMQQIQLLSATPMPSFGSFGTDTKVLTEQGKVLAEQAAKASAASAKEAEGKIARQKAFTDRIEAAQIAKDTALEDLGKDRARRLRERIALKSRIDEARKDLDGSTIDPNRFAKNASPLQKIFLALGAAFSAKGGSNIGLLMIQQLINRDVQAQMADKRKKAELLRALREDYRFDVSEDNADLAAQRLATYTAHRDAIEVAKVIGNTASSEEVKAQQQQVAAQNSIAAAKQLIELDNMRATRKASAAQLNIQSGAAAQRAGSARQSKIAELVKRMQNLGLNDKQAEELQKDLGEIDKAQVLLANTRKVVLAAKDKHSLKAALEVFVSKRQDQAMALAATAAQQMARALGQKGTLTDRDVEGVTIMMGARPPTVVSHFQNREDIARAYDTLEIVFREMALARIRQSTMSLGNLVQRTTKKPAGIRQQ